MFLALEKAADDSTAVRVLSGLEELKAAFNRDHDKVRLLMLLAPSCPGCQRGAREVQTEVLKAIEDKGLKAYAVWEPILRTDNARAARRATILIPDPRVEHFWAPTTQIGETFQGPIALKGEPAWDVYLVYRDGVRWEGDAPPKPDYLMHQLGDRLPNGHRLEGEHLAEQIKGELRDK